MNYARVCCILLQHLLGLGNFCFVVSPHTTWLPLDYHFDFPGWLLGVWFYNNAAKIFGAKGILCRRLGNLEKK